MMLHETMFRAGYTQEEEYFYKLNRDLIDKNKSARDKKNEPPIKCPRCGGTMLENLISKIKVDRCIRCQGIFFDGGEYETLMKSRDKDRFIDLTKAAFRHTH